MSKKHQPKSKTVKKSSKSKYSQTSKRKIAEVDKRLIAKRKDALERKYYINTKTGKRVTEREWKREDEKIRQQRSIRASQQLERAAEIISPFPDGVSPSGVPEKKISFDPTEYEGETFEVDEFEPFPIEGDDETG
jgi:hypothetical protein